MTFRDSVSFNRASALAVAALSWGLLARFHPPIAHGFELAGTDYRMLLVGDLPTVPSAPGMPVAALTPISSALTFTVSPVGNLADMADGNQGIAAQWMANEVLQGFSSAADRWRAQFRDAINVNIRADFGPLGDGVLGGAGSATGVLSYPEVMAALATDASPHSTSDAIAIAIASFQPGPTLDFITNDTTVQGSAPRVRDTDGSDNNAFLEINLANARALGTFAANDATVDAVITFTDFSDHAIPRSWDFDTHDGLTSGSFDFVAAAAHELAHALGFISGVDDVDLFADPSGPGLPALPPNTDLNAFILFRPLDLYRYTDDSLSQPNQPTGGLNDFAISQPTALDRPFFSIDGGVTEKATFSTGAFNGDGRQASHWQANSGFGLMSPTLAAGVIGTISILDVQALDVIGYNPVPEPSSFLIALLGVGYFNGNRSRAPTHTQPHGKN